MPKVEPLTDVENIPAFIQQVNSNFEKIEDAFDNTISRDGSLPNEMNAALDMNGQNIINIGGVSFVDGPVVIADAENVVFDTPVGWTADNVQEGIEEAYQKASDETALVENSVTALSGNAVRVDVAQSHDPSEQTQGRDNLGLGDLAVKDSVDVADIDATGTANADTVLHGDGSWGVVGSDLAYSSPTRAVNTDYTNNTGRLLLVIVAVSSSSNTLSAQVQVGGTNRAQWFNGAAGTTQTGSMTVLVPPGATYRLNSIGGSVTIVAWSEAEIG